MKIIPTINYNPAVVFRVLDMLEGRDASYSSGFSGYFISNMSPFNRCGCARACIQRDQYVASGQSNDDWYDSFRETGIYDRCQNEAAHMGVPVNIILRMEDIYEACFGRRRSGKPQFVKPSSDPRVKHGYQRIKKNHHHDASFVARFLRRALKITEPVQAVPVPTENFQEVNG